MRRERESDGERESIIRMRVQKLFVLFCCSKKFLLETILHTFQSFCLFVCFFFLRSRFRVFIDFFFGLFLVWHFFQNTNLFFDLTVFV